MLMYSFAPQQFQSSTSCRSIPSGRLISSIESEYARALLSIEQPG